MPTYDYKCDACDHRFEKFQSITAKPLRVCPECGKRKVKRLIGTGAGVIFKGSGFYQTDYRSESYQKAAEKDKPTADSDSSKTSDGDKGGSSASGDSGAKKDASDKKPSPEST